MRKTYAFFQDFRKHVDRFHAIPGDIEIPSVSEDTLKENVREQMELDEEAVATRDPCFRQASHS